MKKHFLLMADPSDGGDPKAGDPQKPANPKAGDPPASPGAVKKTPLKTPREIGLEKEISKLQDRQDDLDAKLGEVNNFLEGLELGGLKAVPIKSVPGSATPEPAKGFFNEVEREIWGGN